MSVKREFIDWSLSAIPATVEFLFRRYRREQTLNMERAIIVVPGSRAGRRLLDQLLERAESERVTLFPPTVETVSVFPEQLYRPKLPFASDLTQLMAWIQAMQQCAQSLLSKVVPHPPAQSDFLAWMDLAKTIRRLHGELAAEAMNFEHVAQIGATLPDFTEGVRWNALRTIQLNYLHVLDQQKLWDQQTARLFAIEHQECHTDRDVILVGAVDLNRAVRKMLDQVQDRVTALIFAPPTLLDHFDSHGCLVPNSWKNVRLDIHQHQVLIANSPAQQADEVLHVLRGYGGRYRTDQVVVGVPDQRLLPVLERRLAEQDIATRWVFAKKLKETAPYRLIEAIRDYIDGGSFRAFGSLVRHPDIFDWLAPLTQGASSNSAQSTNDLIAAALPVARQTSDPHDWLTQLDEYHVAHLQNRLGTWLGENGQFAVLHNVYRQVREALRPLMTPESVPLADWAVKLAGVIENFYDSKEVDRESIEGHYLLSAFREVREGLLAFQSIPRELSPPVDVLTAMKLLLDQLKDTELTSRSVPNYVELLGWLELPLDIAPALIVTSFNDGFIPSYQNSDLFLPNQLRRELGLADNLRRYARDAYVLEVLLKSRESITLIVGRTDSEHYPLLPSRLLFACEDRELSGRVQSFFKELPHIASKHRVVGKNGKSELHVPYPEPIVQRQTVPLALNSGRSAEREGSERAEGITSVSVTAFRTYLDCPYRFYLRHVLKLSALTDNLDEMDALSFGNLAHRVLEQFAKHSLSASTDVSDLKRFLAETLKRVATSQLGEDRMPAVDVQIMQLQTRLDAFAEWHVDWMRQGWQIHRVEVDRFPGNPQITVGNRSLALRGRIDRIDYHPGRNEYTIFDYKTSDTARTPKNTHQSGNDWIDLQLPLYRVLAKALGIDAPIQLGYILLPKDPRKVGAAFAEWSTSELDEADRVAQGVAQGILDEVFWPPRKSVFSDEFAPLCQDNVLGRTLAEPPAP